MKETLRAMRGRIETLATAAGEYKVVCARTGQQPVPVDGMWFADRKAARRAAETAAAYRALLRQYDPQTPVHDFVVSSQDDQRSPSVGTPVRVKSREGDA